jgi:hypothetical protein
MSHDIKHTHTHAHTKTQTQTHTRFLSSAVAESNGVYPSMQVLAFLADQALNCEKLPLECTPQEHQAITQSLRDLQGSVRTARQVATAIHNKSAAGVRLLLKVMLEELQGIAVGQCLYVPIGFCNDDELEHNMLVLVWRTAEDEYELTVSFSAPTCARHVNGLQLRRFYACVRARLCVCVCMCVYNIYVCVGYASAETLL